MERRKVFISYSHKDAKYRQELVKHLSLRKDLLEIWPIFDSFQSSCLTRCLYFQGFDLLEVGKSADSWCQQMVNALRRTSCR